MNVTELLEAIGHGQEQSTVEIHTVYGERMRVTGVETRRGADTTRRSHAT
jgi:hypothetical protein